MRSCALYTSIVNNIIVHRRHPRFRCRQVYIGSSSQVLRTFPKTVKSQPIDFLWLSPGGNFFFSTFHCRHYIITIVSAKLDYSTYSPPAQCSFTVGNNPLQQEKAQCDAWTVFGSSMIIQTAIFWQDFGFNYHPQRLKKKKNPARRFCKVTETCAKSFLCPTVVYYS